MKTEIDWNETRECKGVKQGCKGAMLLLHVHNSRTRNKFDEWNEPWLREAHAVMLEPVEKVVKIFGCPECGLKFSEEA